MSSSWKCVVVLFMATFLLGCAEGPSVGSVSEPDPDYVPPENRLTEFEFTDQLGKPFNSKTLDGKVWLGSFFFADCPSICVQQNTQIAKLHERFAEEGVMIVEFTVAPDKDPAAKLWTYGERFNADHNTWKFLTGKDIDYVRQVGADMFGLPAADETHTSDVVVFNRQGEMQHAYDVMDDQEFAKCVDKIQTLLKEEALPGEENSPREEQDSLSGTDVDSSKSEEKEITVAS